MRIVTAHHLKRWAETMPIDAESETAELVRSLVRASCPSLEYNRFPGGNASRTHGWDGVTELKDGVTFVPEGRAIWEFGAGAGYQGKANSDFTKRSDELTVDERGRHTFIFVTPRIWDTGLEDWIKEHSGGGWRKVQIYDANTLENWLADQPAVSIPLAKRLGILPPTGFQTVQDFWDEHSLNTIPPLMEDLLLKGREDRAKRLCEGLSAGLRGLSKWQADSATEAAIFVAAAIRRAEEEVSQFLLSKTLFIESNQGAQQVPPTGGFNLILFPESHRFGAALARTNQVILVLGAGDLASDAESLDQMSTLDFAAGLRSMGVEENEAFRLACICCRSVVVFSRLNARGAVARPEWSGSPGLNRQTDLEENVVRRILDDRAGNLAANSSIGRQGVGPPSLQAALLVFQPTAAWTGVVASRFALNPNVRNRIGRPARCQKRTSNGFHFCIRLPVRIKT